MRPEPVRPFPPHRYHCPACGHAFGPNVVDARSSAPASRAAEPGDLFVCTHCARWSLYAASGESMTVRLPTPLEARRIEHGPLGEIVRRCQREIVAHHAEETPSS